MKTFILFCCTVMSGIGFASGAGELVGEEMYTDIVKDLDCKPVLETDQAKILDAGVHFEWFLNHRKNPMSNDEGPAIAGHKWHTIFTWRIHNQQQKIPHNLLVPDYFSVFLTKNGDKPTMEEVKGKPGYVYVAMSPKYVAAAMKQFEVNNSEVFKVPPKKWIIHFSVETIGPKDNTDYQELRVVIQTVVTE